jgi:hypothetical protein
MVFHGIVRQEKHTHWNRLMSILRHQGMEQLGAAICVVTRRNHDGKRIGGRHT